MPRFNALFMIAAAAIVQLCTAAEFKVRVRNLTWMQPFSPLLVVAHTTDVQVFEEGSPAISAVQAVAENGDNSALLDLADQDAIKPFVCGLVVADNVLLPGETWMATMDVDMDACKGNGVFSVIAMLGNTNDAFVGLDSWPLPRYLYFKLFLPAFDAGTEENNELCAYIPGPACDDVPGNLAAGGGEGFVHIHRGVHGIGDITESIYDWRSPVAEMVIVAPVS